MTLPSFNEHGYLPEGDHEADLDEIEERFGQGRRRREIVTGLRSVIALLSAHGVLDIWLDGSFVTDKLRPSDVDVVYRVRPGGDKGDWPDVGPSQRHRLKRDYRVDLWRYPSPQPMKNAFGANESLLITIKQFFETDDEDIPKGMVKVALPKEDGK